jgi:hypothetical protein
MIIFLEIQKTESKMENNLVGTEEMRNGTVIEVSIFLKLENQPIN